ncbi:GYF domain [Rhizoctonia solani]|uniref:GYF domain n=1 Tax=Rhizoctonia solani TaxID=456999 RepID=A0A8H7IJP5_9AGAM|nr:GYF domain [Rhizoctonia solani]
MHQTPTIVCTTASPPLPKQPLYESSTQFKHWRFSPEQLAKSRRELNQAAVESLKKLLEEEEPGSTSSIHFLTPEEERALVVYYARVIGSMCVRIGLSEEVEATATSYLKRFYLKNTVMDWHPMNVTITILFLATKTSNMPISLDYYVSKLPSGKTEAADVLALEFLVAQSLNFEFSVWHAHRALWALSWIFSIPEIDQESTKHTHSAALQHIRNSRLTDAELIYTPSQIAIACLYLADPQLAETYLSQKGSGNMLSVVQEAAAMIERDGKGTDVGLVREIDFRLKTCKNPERVKGSKRLTRDVWDRYEARQAKADAAADKKRALKATASLEARMSQDEMFGPSISLPSGDPQSSAIPTGLGRGSEQGRMTELGLTGDTIGGIAEVDSPTSAQFVDVQGNLKDEENGGEGGDMAGPLLDKVPEVRITETSSPSPPPPRTSTQTDPLPHSHASSSRASLLPPAAATGSTRRPSDNGSNRLSGFFSQLLTTRRPEREPPMPRERSVSPPPSPMRPTRPVTPPPPLAPPTLSELGLQLSIITSNLTTAQYAMAPTSGTFLAPHYLLLCHGQGLDVLPLNAPPAPSPGVLVAIAGRRDGVRVYALEEVRRAVEWRLDLELQARGRSRTSSRSKGTPGVTIPASNSAPSALQPSKPTAPPRATRPVSTRPFVRSSLAHRGGSLSSIVGLAQNGTQKSEWAELQASDEEVLVAAGPEASAALDERTSAAAQAPTASSTCCIRCLSSTSNWRHISTSRNRGRRECHHSILHALSPRHSRSNSQLLPRGPTTAETDAEPEVGIDSVSMAEMLRESRMPPPQVPANTTQRRASVVMLQSQTHPVFQPGELDPVGEDTDPPPTPGDDVRPRRAIPPHHNSNSSRIDEPIRPIARAYTPSGCVLPVSYTPSITSTRIPPLDPVPALTQRSPTHTTRTPTSPIPQNPQRVWVQKAPLQVARSGGLGPCRTSSGAGPSGNGHTEGAPPEGPAAAPKLEYIKLPGTKGAIMIKAVETPKKSFLAILCGESGEKVELFAGTYRTALGLSRTFILPDSPKSLELQLQGDDLVEVFLVFAQNVFGLEPATVRVREVRIGRNERRAIRRRARAANGGSRTIEPSEAGQAGGGAASRAAETVITTTVSVGEDHQPASPASRRSTSLVRRRREVQGRIVTAPDVPVPIPPVRRPQPTDPTMAEELAALSSIQSGPYTTFQQLSFAPQFPLAAIADDYIIPPTYLDFCKYRETWEPNLPRVEAAPSQMEDEPVVVVEGMKMNGDEQAIIESSPIPTPSHTPPPPVQPAQVLHQQWPVETIHHAKLAPGRLSPTRTPSSTSGRDRVYSVERFESELVPPTPTVIPPTPVDEPVVIKPEPVRASGSELTEVPEKVESVEESGTHIPAVERTSTPGASTSSVAEPSGSNTPVEANGTNTPSKASTSQIPAEVNTSKPPTESSPSQTPAQTQPSSSTSQTTSKPNPPDPFKPTKALLKPLSLLAQPRHFGSGAVLLLSRRTQHNDRRRRGRPVLKGRIHWSSNDAMGTRSASRRRDRGAGRGRSAVGARDESRTAVPAYRVAVSGGTSRRAPWVWKLGTSVSALGNSAVDTPQPSAATGNGNASGHGMGMESVVRAEESDTPSQTTIATHSQTVHSRSCLTKV